MTRKHTKAKMLGSDTEAATSFLGFAPAPSAPSPSLEAQQLERSDVRDVATGTP